MVSRGGSVEEGVGGQQGHDQSLETPSALHERPVGPLESASVGQALVAAEEVAEDVAYEHLPAAVGRGQPAYEIDRIADRLLQRRVARVRDPAGGVERDQPPGWL